MTYVYNYLFVILWAGFLIYWRAMERNVKANSRIEPRTWRVVRSVLMWIAVLLLWFKRVPVAVINRRFLPNKAWVFWIGAVVTAGGLLFAIWARRYLGRNWSSEVTVKEGHELITSGPYSIVRHPIYTGILLGFVGSAIARGEWRGLIAVALVVIALWCKLKLEEEWMRSEFGETYGVYSKRVRALVPGVL